MRLPPAPQATEAFRDFLGEGEVSSSPLALPTASEAFRGFLGEGEASSSPLALPTATEAFRGFLGEGEASSSPLASPMVLWPKAGPSGAPGALLGAIPTPGHR
ncbi:hypothetical protein NDU88_003789 [Pleurodeles waltl]|uniref:Uncharacterized protein n=1 Tax=Pleurodeles waltl TaxID=8319 RepID=A0AAV7TQP5_PLEWA|nr:hypothetical protein NDU88_003789 [Pleurodeles waltl]